ncbi:tetratricopeptide repeat protein [Shewanella fidelis]|uniref:tetratricopeptide repeat protein n=1 Tax=Shewanella fidelis TaxID=173509 RepID=UPI00048DF621|nr:tetratricopeptide repeat protein [Shewanella fidelis]
MLNIKKLFVLSLTLLAVFSTMHAEASVNLSVPLPVPSFSTAPIGMHEPQVNVSGQQVLKQVTRLLELQDLQAASIELRQGLGEHKPTNAALLYTLATIELQQNQTKSAVSSLNQALAALPDFTRAQSVLAGIYTQQGEFDMARPLLQAAIKRQASASLYGMLAYGYLKQQVYLAAKAAYQQAIVLDGLNNSYLKGLLQVNIALQEWSSAESILQTLLSQQTMDAELLLVRANIAQHRGEDIAAINSLQLALSLNGKTSSQTNNIRWQLAQMYLKVGAFGSANQTLTSLVNQETLPEPKQIVAALDYLLIMGQAKQVKQLASSLLSNPAANQSLQSELWMLLGRAELTFQRDANAASAFAKAVKANPLNGEAYIQQALLLRSSNQQQAQILLARAADIETSAVRALTLQAQILLDIKAYDRALLALTKAYRLAPDTHGLKENLSSVERLVQLAQTQL